MDDFYTSLTSFQHFNGVADPTYYQPVPADWAVFISDVRGSTKAIAAGKYKEVNMVGAASIVVTRNAMGSLDFPFVFGGDGATLLIPPSKIEPVIRELSTLKALAVKNFELDLRVGMIRVKQLYEEGKQLDVARFELTPGRCLAMFRGDGMDVAEEWIKRSGEKFEVSTGSVVESDLSGLSCRWHPIPSKNGKVLTLIVYARRNTDVFQRLLAEMDGIFPEGIESLNPAQTQTAKYKSVWACLREERKYHPSLLSRSFLKRAKEIVISVGLFKYRAPYDFVQPYLDSISAHSDFRKFDNMLRMVIDCRPDQVLAVKALFERLHTEGLIYYGTFEAEKSLMTCFVESLSQGNHIHFMDAENGGYAMAAVALKRQMSENGMRG